MKRPLHLPYCTIPLVQNQLTYPVIRCIVYPVKGSVELCGAGWLISPVSIRFEDTAKLGNLHLAPRQDVPEVIRGIEADGGQ